MHLKKKWVWLILHFIDFGIGVSPYLLGIIEPSIGFANVYAFCALLVVMALILYCLLIVKKASY
ncbi:hypothetical protein L8V92_02250 [Campylobacter lari]|nr:hypothetical protein [Campylobacter lari]MCV3421254.1 hypothetical protein [Campylobacter lari]